MREDQPVQHFADRLLAACDDKRAPVCVGLDPVAQRLPEGVSLVDYCIGVVDAVAAHVPCIKPQLACFERHGRAGWEAYERLVDHARGRGLLVIADAKRGDIGISASHYAAAFFAGDHPADALTINAYLGGDGVEPFIDAARQRGCGLFSLVRTSNPGGDALQGLMLDDGRTVGEAVADLIAGLGAGHTGSSGYSLLGAVVGATRPRDAASLRARMPSQVFLVPGFGAQGGTAEDVRACFDPAGRGAIITASRSVIYAYESGRESDWQRAVADAAADLNRQIAAILRP
jgi:orotidine-5'-phosphate decarboxylase